jgi:uncharacterized phosphatase
MVQKGKTMKHLYFVRHGESLINVGEVFASSMNSRENLGLTELGKQQALAAGKKAAGEGFTCDLIISSPLLRARETAEIIAREIQYPVQKIQISELFIEIQFGELEGTNWYEYWGSGKSYKDLHNYKGAETLEMLQERAEKALAYMRSLPQENILIASHSAFGRAFKRAIASLPYTDEFISNTSLPYGEIFKLI